MGRFSILAILALAGCATTTSYLKVCPIAVPYSAAFEQAAAIQMETLPSGSPVVIMLDDYSANRKADRDCAK